MNSSKEIFSTVIIGLVLFTTISASEEKQKLNDGNSGETVDPKTGSTLTGVIGKVVPNPIRNLFKGETNNKENESNQESGNLDFIGRDVIREVAKGVGKVKGKVDRAIGKVSETLGFTASNTSAGLDSSNKTFFGEVASEFMDKVSAIYPGTKWCGDGNIAKSYDDVGLFKKTDKCCRQHDGCPENIPAGESKYGLQNTGLFTRSHCDCDKEFYDCLNNSSEIVSKKIGFTYFTVLGPQCFQQDYPITGCQEMSTAGTKCLKYDFDQSGEKRYQWFDSPTFIKLF